MTGADIVAGGCGKQGRLIEAWERFEGKIDCEYTGKLWSGKELIDLSIKIAEEMKAAGFLKGDIVALLLTNTIAFPVVLMALLYLECNPLLMNPAAPKPELERMVQKLPIKYFIHDYIEGISRFGTHEDIMGSINVGNATIEIGKTCLNLKYELARISGVILHPTSGTYGEPGICIRNQEVAVAEGVNYISSIDLYDRIRIMLTTPLSHAFAYGFGLISSILTNSEMVISPSFNPKKVLRSLSKNPCDILTIVPPMARILIMLKESYTDFRMGKTVFYAGAHCSEILMNKFEEVFDARLYNIYGSTETGAISSNYTADGKLPGVGKVLKNVSFCINNMDKYWELGDAIGEVNVKSSSMMQGYYSKDWDDSQEIDYFCTGDIGSIIDGNIILQGRSKDIINVNGMKVDGKEIENIILGYPEIKDVVVYPGMDENNNEIMLCGICGNSSSIDLDALRAYCVENMAYHKIPRIFHIMSELPRTASGKCIKTKLPGYKSLI